MLNFTLIDVNIFFLLLLLLTLPVIFTAIFHISRKNNNSHKELKNKFLLFDFPRKARFIDYLELNGKYRVATGISVWDNTKRSFEIPFIELNEERKFINVLMPSSYSIERIQVFFTSKLSLANYRIEFNTFVSKEFNNSKAWRKFLKYNKEVFKILRASGFSTSNVFLYITAFNEFENKRITVVAYNSNHSRRKNSVLVAYS